jgi:hypothetical protein
MKSTLVAAPSVVAAVIPAVVTKASSVAVLVAEAEEKMAAPLAALTLASSPLLMPFILLLTRQTRTK